MKARLIPVAGAPLLLLACASQGQREEEKLQMMEKAGVAGWELCDAQQRVSAAYLDDGNQQKYEKFRKLAKGTCDEADSIAATHDVYQWPPRGPAAGF
ncbi:hypothetical protein [Sphingobium olei]|uniref:Lipoprotein n=1 Tax=Sphingobium olei TaxID=420955 RepID=A0ABW3P9W8_9SPHN|nr:hypothetical protein [Sphingobium sp.]